MTTHRYSHLDLAQFCITTGKAAGLGDEAARLLADSLIQADLWGHQSHGVMRLFWYLKRLTSGATRVDAVPELLVDAGALAVVDGQDGLGQLTADFAIKQAIVRAKQHGVGAVSVRNSGHFGTAMYYTRQAAEADCIGFLSTNASPAMAPWGGCEKRVGTNPWSIAAPAGEYPPMLLDIANTAVARGKLYLAQKQGQAIPEDWAIDALGNPTSDPAAGIAGTLLPMAGHKGYAIATMIDVLSGVLSGSGFGRQVIGPYQPSGAAGVGHFICVIDIGKCRPIDEFYADMARLIEELKSTPKAPTTEEIFYPGELEARADTRHRQTGIALPADTVAALNAGAREYFTDPLQPPNADQVS